ncbi:MAG: hypothetical protein JKY96_05910 [Phycisphaerales bacterium]|nr:hypothetical protein [Phycisphaerales bacterium]
MGARVFSLFIRLAMVFVMVGLHADLVVQHFVLGNGEHAHLHIHLDSGAYVHTHSDGEGQDDPKDHHHSDFEQEQDVPKIHRNDTRRDEADATSAYPSLLATHIALLCESEERQQTKPPPRRVSAHTQYLSLLKSVILQV